MTFISFLEHTRTAEFFWSREPFLSYRLVVAKYGNASHAGKRAMTCRPKCKGLCNAA
jgi:hypothetical protein